MVEEKHYICCIHAVPKNPFLYLLGGRKYVSEEDEHVHSWKLKNWIKVGISLVDCVYANCWLALFSYP